MLKKVMQKTKDFSANLIQALSSAKSKIKDFRFKPFVDFLKKDDIAKKVLIYSAVAFAATLITVISLFASVKKVVVNDGVKTSCIYTLRSNPLDVLKTAEFINGEYTVTAVDNISGDTVINLRYTFPVFVTVNNKTTEVEFMRGDTVAKAIELAGFKLDEHDIVNLPIDTVLTETAYIDVTDINYVTDTYTQSIPYSRKTVYDSSSSSSKLISEGKEGIKKITAVTKFVNGVVETTSVISEEIVSPAVDRVFSVGTKENSKSNPKSDSNKKVVLDQNGHPINYVKHITVQATAYSCGTHTASGMKLEPGCVAVNPKIFPYGTKFYIKSSDGKYVYGYAVSADTGGFVKTRPTNFDLYFRSETECVNFGRRNIEVYVLK